MNIGMDLRPLLSSHRTGVGIYTYELLDALFTLDKSNRYFLFCNTAKDAKKFVPHWDQPNVQYVNGHWPNKLFNLAIKLTGRPRLEKLCAKKLDAWFASNFGFIALRKETKFVLTVHDLSFEFWPEFFSAKQRMWHRAVRPRRLCERANMIIAPSTNTRRDLINYYQIPPEKIQIIYPGLSKNFKQIKPGEQWPEIRKKYGLPDNYSLFLGTIEPRKNIGGLIDAFALAAEKLPPDYHLVIAGPPGWKTNPILQKIQSSKLKNKIILTGYITEEEKPYIYAKAKLFIFPSFYEGFGFPVLEAMATGTPVICSDRGSLPEIVGGTGQMVNPYDTGEIAEAIIKACTTKNNSQTKNSQDLAAAFSWQITAEKLLKILLTN